jgi:hypothetical protein
MYFSLVVRSTAWWGNQVSVTYTRNVCRPLCATQIDVDGAVAYPAVLTDSLLEIAHSGTSPRSFVR